MKRYNDLPSFTQDNLKGWMITPFVIFAVAWTIAFCIDVLAIEDQNDAAAAQHVGNVPSQVIELSDSDYLILASAKATPLDICLGSNTDGTGAVATKRIDQLKGVYVKCYLDQQWGIAKDSIDPNLGESLDISIQKSAFIITGIIGLIATLLLPLFMALREMVAVGMTRKDRKAEAKQKYDKLTARYRAIQSAYSKDEIDDLQFDRKVQDLVSEGYELPDKDIFKT